MSKIVIDICRLFCYLKIVNDICRKLLTGCGSGGIKEMDVWCDYPNDNIKLKILSGDADSIEAIPMSQPVALREAERVWIQRKFSAAVIASANRSEGRKKSS